MEEYIFTFGSGQDLEGYFVRIKGKDYFDCRRIMFEKFGEEWAFEYPLEKWNEWVEKAKTLHIPVEKELLCIENEQIK